MKTTLFAWILALVVMSTTAFALPLNVVSVEVDDFVLTPNDINRMDVQRNAEHLVEIRFTPTQDIRNAELEIFVSGFEFRDIHPIRDSTGIFDADANVTYTKRLSFKLTDEVDEDDYKLRLMFSDRNGVETIQTYNLKFDVPRHSLRVEDIVFTPNGAVKAGQALLTTIRIENKGEKREDDVRIEVKIPELGIVGVDYIDEIRTGREEETEEIFMKIPACAKGGDYQVNIRVMYNQLHDIGTATAFVHILPDSSCEKSAAPSVLVTLDGTEPVDENLTLPKQPTFEKNEAPKVMDGGEWDNMSTLRRGLEVTLIVLLVTLTTLGVLIGVSRMARRD
ncbi:hypothetical protein HY641_05190 [Candidatus Woesearchaeota archaeon]|nr:hypothetical protein [Candidatus Woesearchaeota archaeon]